MALLDILLVDHPILLKKAHKVDKVTPEIRQLIDDMIETMRAANGVGLAGPQVGVSQRVIVVEYAENDDEEEETQEEETRPPKKKLYALINPEITYRSDELVEGAEGCLSIPDWVGLVDRHVAVGVRGLDRNGRKTTLKLEGWLARIFQHEIDHLDGILYTSRITSPEKLWRMPPESESQETESKTALG